MSQDEAKQQAWETYKEAKTKIDEQVKEACASAEKLRDDVVKASDQAIALAEDRYYKEFLETRTGYADDYDRVERTYHEALAHIANTETPEEPED